MATSQDLLIWLRSAAEATRLRLLALCAERDLSVSDLAEALGQSEPRVSRHLRILTEAGLLERIRHGQWVHYRLAREAPAAQFTQGLLGQWDRSDPARQQDLRRASGSSAPASTGPGVSRLGRELRAVLETELAEQPRSVLLVGVGHLELLDTAARRARQCAAIAHSRRAAQAARALLERERLACRIVPASGGEWLSEADLERAGGDFEAVILDHLAAAEPVKQAVLAAARAALPSEGRLWLFERYPAATAERVVEHPIAQLRRRLAEAGLECQRIRPIEADGQHVLVASAAPAHGGVTLSRTG